MTTIKRKITSLAITGQLKLMELLEKGRCVLKNKSGASHTTEVLVWVLGVVVVAAIIIGLMILLIKDDIFPMFSEKLKEIFNMK